MLFLGKQDRILIVTETMDGAARLDRSLHGPMRPEVATDFATKIFSGEYIFKRTFKTLKIRLQISDECYFSAKFSSPKWNGSSKSLTVDHFL